MRLLKSKLSFNWQLIGIYKLRCKTFEYSSEEFNTGHPDIDTADDRKSLDTSLQYQFLLEDGTFSRTSSTGRLILESGDKHGNPQYLIQEEFDDTITDGDAAHLFKLNLYIDNLDLDTEAGFDTATVSDDILDFTESNLLERLNNVWNTFLQRRFTKTNYCVWSNIQ